MDIKLRKITVRELSEGYEDRDEDGVVAFGGALDVRPPYQREFIYGDKQRDAVIDTLTKDRPLNVMYWAVRADGGYEVIDGQQRTISICQYIDGEFSFNDRYFHNLQDDEKEQILNYRLMVYLCSGTDSEKLDWFKTINIAGAKLTNQELRNAVYHGSFVSDAKRYFSKNGCPAYAIASDYMSGTPIRQDYLESVIEWINDGDVENYMAVHQHDANANELWLYFQKVIAWVKVVFVRSPDREMKGLDWGRLYAAYHERAYDSASVDAEVNRLRADTAVDSKKGIYEYVLGGCTDTRLLSIRMFDERTKATKYAQQTASAQADGVSNCPLCAVGPDANKTRIYALGEMDADHVEAWSRGGATDISNCQMLCVPHNRAKGNR